jgi:hypothetical protein
MIKQKRKTKIQRKKQTSKLLLLANEIKFMILSSCENDRDMLNLGKTCESLYRLYIFIVNDPRKYNFYQTRYNSPIPRMFEFKAIQKKRIHSYVIFNEKYSKCVECEKKKLCCDTKSRCNNCTRANIQCEKKETKRKLFIKRGERYCNSIDYSTSFTRLIMSHKDDIQKIGKKICDRCGELAFCNNNSIVLNNCCNVNFCIYSNINHLTMNLYGTNFSNHCHSHQLCEICYNSIGKTTPITLYNNYTFSAQ